MTDDELQSEADGDGDDGLESDVAPSAAVELDLSPHWSLDSSITFLNHGSFGACPRRVRNYRQDLLDQMESEPVRFFTRELPGLLDRARAEAAEFVGSAPKNFAFMTNTTEGVNAVLRSLELEAGDQILITDHGYGACNNAARFVADRAGAEVVVADLPFPVEDPQQIVDAIAASVTDRTKIAIVDHITAFSAMVLPIAEIVSALEKRGVPTLVDGAHAPGMVDLNLEEIGPAFYAGNFHKWVCSPRGAAFLHVRDDFLDKVRPLAISHGASIDSQERSRFHLEFDWQGTRDFTPWLSVPTSIDFLKSLMPGGWRGIRRRNRELAIWARRLLCDTVDAEPTCPESMVGFTAAVELPIGDGPLPDTPFEVDPLQTALFSEAGIEVPIFVILSPPHRLLRISAHLHNGRADYEALAQAMTQLE